MGFGWKLSSVCSDVGTAVRTVVVGILARVYHIRNPETGPTDKQAKQSGKDVRFCRRFVIQSGDDVLLAGWAGDWSRIWTNLGCRDYRVYIGGLLRMMMMTCWRNHVGIWIIRRWRWWMGIALLRRLMRIAGWLRLVRYRYEAGCIGVRGSLIVHRD